VGCCSQPAGRYVFSHGNGNSNHHLGAGFLVHKSLISAVKRVEFISNRISYITLRGRSCDIDVLNVHARTEYKSDKMKDTFHKELERVFDHFSEYHMEILLRDFNSEVGIEDIFKQTTWNIYTKSEMAENMSGRQHTKPTAKSA